VKLKMMLMKSLHEQYHLERRAVDHGVELISRRQKTSVEDEDATSHPSSDDGRLRPRCDLLDLRLSIVQ